MLEGTLGEYKNPNRSLAYTFAYILMTDLNECKSAL